MNLDATSIVMPTRTFRIGKQAINSTLYFLGADRERAIRIVQFELADQGEEHSGRSWTGALILIRPWYGDCTQWARSWRS